MSFKPFLVLRSSDWNDANVRLQSDSLVEGLTRLGILTRAVHPSKIAEIPLDCCIAFHYNDHAVIQLLSSIDFHEGNKTVICLCSDIYSMEVYVKLESYVNFYLTPTDLHRQVLSSAISKPVYTLPERIDPVIEATRVADALFPPKYSKRCLLFGYAESFYKSMSSLLPVLNQNIASGTLDSFEVVLDIATFKNYLGLSATDYSATNFQQVANKLDYCILSHFSLDLSLNSHIKSPNKLITALFSGLIPLCSRTPNYEKILREFKLERFLFGSPAELDRLLRSLDPVADSQAISDSGILPALRARLAPDVIAEQLLRILKMYEQETEQLNLEKQTMDSGALIKHFMSHGRQLAFREHLRDLLPSVNRSIKIHRHRRAAMQQK
jgi:hypothetical protein